MLLAAARKRSCPIAVAENINIDAIAIEFDPCRIGFGGVRIRMDDQGGLSVHPSHHRSSIVLVDKRLKVASGIVIDCGSHRYRDLVPVKDESYRTSAV